ncbi:MAG: PilX N-terminal [Pseudomonadota bacterium]|jgi:Tfp pilus assembly protein PilX
MMQPQAVPRLSSFSPVVIPGGMPPGLQRQRGVALSITLILLIVFTFLSVFALSTSVLELRMSGNVQQSMDSFESAEAGVAAVLRAANSESDPTKNPFNGQKVGDVNAAPLAGVTSAPLAGLSPGTVVDARTVLTEIQAPCPRAEAESASAADTVVCDYYRIESTAETAAQARTRVAQGAARQVLKMP